MKYVIIGNSAAGIGGVEGVRQIDAQGQITLITDESTHTYSRPLISYLLQGKTTQEKMLYRPADFYEKNKVKLVYGKAVKLEPNQVVLEGGEAVPFNKLLVATGSSAFVPPIEGLESVQNRFTFMKLSDALAIELQLTPETRVFVLGAGLIGLKAAEGIAARVKSVTVADLAPRILPSILDEAGAALVQNRLAENGIRIITGAGAARFSENTATLTTGEEIPFDLLLVCVGVRPNTGLVADAGGKVVKGIITGSRQETSLPGVYAAGDCTESYDEASGKNGILAILPNAYMQGECAGRSMAGADTQYEKAIAMNAIGFFGLHVITAGAYEGEALGGFEPGVGYKRLFIKDGLLKGFILIDAVEGAGIYTTIIKDKIPLQAVDFELLQKRPQLLAYSGEERKGMLARAH